MTDDIKRKLQGRAFTRTMKERGTNKWRLAKKAGVSYRTLGYWEKKIHAPSDELAERVAFSLGLITEI